MILLPVTVSESTPLCILDASGKPVIWTMTTEDAIQVAALLNEIQKAMPGNN